MAGVEQRHTVELSRNLGFFDATMIGVGAMIGAGIFVLTGLAINRAGPAALLAFGLNGVVTTFTALSYAELASSIPEAGGGYAFVKKVMPNWVAFISGWMLWFAYIVACSLYARGFGSYLLEFLNEYAPRLASGFISSLGETGTVVIMTVLVAIAFLGLNIVGTHATGKAENIITVAKIAILAVFIGFGIAAAVEKPDVVAANFEPFMATGLTGVLAAMGLIFIAFEGYDLIATVSEEVKDPRRTIPRAILASLGITVIIYMLVVFVTLAAVPSVGGIPTWEAIGALGETGIIGAAEAFMPSFGVLLVLFGGVFATLSALNATIMASSRVAFAMGRDWMLPHRLSRLHAIRKTPVLAITVTGILLIAIAAASSVGDHRCRQQPLLPVDVHAGQHCAHRLPAALEPSRRRGLSGSAISTHAGAWRTQHRRAGAVSAHQRPSCLGSRWNLGCHRSGRVRRVLPTPRRGRRCPKGDRVPSASRPEALRKVQSYGSDCQSGTHRTSPHDRHQGRQGVPRGCAGASGTATTRSDFLRGW